jgi:hypothetical protein
VITTIKRFLAFSAFAVCGVFFLMISTPLLAVLGRARSETAPPEPVERVDDDDPGVDVD